MSYEPELGTDVPYRAVDAIVSGRRERIKNNICFSCNREEVKFRDKRSLDEYYISGLCQECQDKTFGEDY
jgi:hypothetical protein